MIDFSETRVPLPLPARFPHPSLQLNVACGGSGPPILLLHGWCNDWRGWTLVARELAREFTLYMPDLPGFGHSDPLPRYDVELVGEILCEFLRARRIRPAAIVGASLGTLIGGHLADRQPGVTERLVLIGPVLSAAARRKRLAQGLLRPWRNRPWGQKVVAAIVRSRLHAYGMEYFFNARRFRAELIRKYGMPGRRRVTGRAYVQLGLDALDVDLDAILPRARQEILLLRGEADTHVSGPQIDRLAATYSHLQARHIPEAGHNIGYESPVLTARVIIDFIQGSTG